MAITDHFAGISPRHARAAAREPSCEWVDLLDVPEAAWRDLAARSADANPFYLPGWARAVARHAKGRAGARALLAWESPARQRLLGLMPVIPAWRALRMPVPVMVAWHGYAPLAVPMIDGAAADAAALGLVEAARRAGAWALLLPACDQESAALTALRRATAVYGAPWQFNTQPRAALNATLTADAAFSAIAAKTRKELRRLRHRAESDGAIGFSLSASPAQTLAALEDFLFLEAAGWKGARRSALASHPGDAAFVREAVASLAQSGAAQVATLRQSDRALAAGIIVRHKSRAFFFKIAHDEATAKMSPGVQLTLDLTQAFCADPQTDCVDSLADSDHPMIDRLWRNRIMISDWLLPVRPEASSFFAIKAAVAARHVLRSVAKRVLSALR